MTVHLPQVISDNYGSCCLTRKCYQGSPPLGGGAMPSAVRGWMRSGGTT
jgi:hypothetical protein